MHYILLMYVSVCIMSFCLHVLRFCVVLVCMNSMVRQRNVNYGGFELITSIVFFRPVAYTHNIELQLVCSCKEPLKSCIALPISVGRIYLNGCGYYCQIFSLM